MPELQSSVSDIEWDSEHGMQPLRSLFRCATLLTPETSQLLAEHEIG